MLSALCWVDGGGECIFSFKVFEVSVRATSLLVVHVHNLTLILINNILSFFLTCELETAKITHKSVSTTKTYNIVMEL